MPNPIKVKRGATLRLTCTWSSAVASLTITSLAKSKRFPQFFASLARSAHADPNKFYLTADTASWPIGTLFYDVKIADGSTTLYTETGELEVEENMTP